MGQFSTNSPSKVAEGADLNTAGAANNNQSRSPAGGHLDFLDPIRGIAILLVFLYHSLGASFGRDQLPWGHLFRTLQAPRSFLPLIPASFGWAGVAIFFVVSGFCIHLSFSRSPRWSSFFWRRFFRIYPVYLITLLFFAFVFSPTSLRGHSSWGLHDLVSHVLLFHNLTGSMYSINASYWSIGLEVQLYLLYPVVILFSARFGWRRTLVALAAIEIAFRLILAALVFFPGIGLPNYIAASPFGYWFSWSIGAYLAERHIKGIAFSVPKYFIYLSGIAAVAFTFFRPLYSFSFMLFAVFTASVVAYCLQNGGWQLPAPRALLTHLGKVGMWSYSLYLWHQPFVAAVPRLLLRIAPGVHFHPLFKFASCLLLWIAIVPVAHLSYKFFELPSIEFGKRFYSRRRKQIQPAEAPVAVAVE